MNSDPAEREPRRYGFTVSLVLAGYVLACVFLLFLPLSLEPGSHLPDDGDALQTMWMMAWIAHKLPRDPSNVFDTNVYFPHPRGLTYSEHFIPQGLLVASFMALGANLVLAYNLLATGTLVLISLSTAFLARELGLSWTSAAAAGIVSAVSSFNLEEVSRLHVLFMPFLPLALAFLIRFFRTGTWWSASAFAASFVLQGLASHYYLISFPIFLVPLVVLGIFLFPERRNVRDALKLASPLVVGALLLLPVELPYLETFRSYRFQQKLPEGVDLMRYFVPPGSSLLYRGVVGEGSWRLPGSNVHFAGYVPLLLAGIGSLSLLRRRPREKLLLGIGALGLVFAGLSLGANVWVNGWDLGPGPYRLLYDHVPFFHYARVPERLSVYFALSLALVAGVGAGHILSFFRRRAQKTAAVLAFLVLVPLEHARVLVRPYARIPTPEEVPEVYRWLGSVSGDFAVAEFPVYLRRELRLYGYENYFSTFHWKRLFFGRPSFYPPALEYLLWSFQDFPSEETTRILQAFSVRTLLYHPGRDPERESTIRRLKRDPNYRFLRDFPDASEAAARLDYGRELAFAVVPHEMPDDEPRYPHRPIPRDNFRFETSSTSDPRLAIDGDPETSWSSLAFQQKGQFFDVELGGEYPVSRISLGFVYPYSEFPRAISVNGYHPSHRWQRLQFRRDPWDPARLVKRLIEDPSKATMDLELLEPMKLTRVRLFIERTLLGDALPAWRIPEIRIDQSAPES